MKKIVVAGCGHGGLTAAANLAQKGFDVTVVEAAKREDLGYDWHDSVRKRDFVDAGLPIPDESNYLPADRMCYYNPKKNVKIVPDREASQSYAYMDRKFLINHLIDFALECGVNIIFESKVLSAICTEDSVVGIRYENNGGIVELRGDLVIDACGLYSPVRLSLPDVFGVSNKVDNKDVFYAWRAYYNKTDNTITDPESNIYFFHCGKAGMDWAITKDGYMDILVGGFGSLTSEDIKKAVKDFKTDYPFMGDEIIRGGKSDRIPLGKSLPVFVCNGYAAVGNSAYMTEPLSGSGIDLSIFAGKLLSETVSTCNGDCCVENLWMYNFLYIKTQSEKRYNSAIIKSLMSSLDASDIDFLMERGIMTEKEIAGTGGRYSIVQLIQKLAVIFRPRLYLPLISILRKTWLAKKLKRNIPKNYSKEVVESWAADYAKL
ncbi:MAG: NAD(P)/FAD-dependent oxidoreductase [Clostridia bacterium]|nr:NAD(P)/FAD-dependent oxidoreductase [Clostridia bacterium]